MPVDEGLPSIYTAVGRATGAEARNRAGGPVDVLVVESG